MILSLIKKFLFFIALVMAVAHANAQKDTSTKQGEGLVNKLLAPGPLMKGHQDLEHGDCLKCHDAGQGVPNSRCLDCHTAIEKSIKTKDSFHATNASKPCITCHSDHKGRNYDSTIVKTSSFDHSLTGFSLRGAHTKIKCSSCHTETRANKATRRNETRFFGGRDESCIGCHKKEDPHRFPGKLGAKECSACHSESSWKGAQFAHLQETGYALIGNHAKLACSKCHNGWDSKSVKYEFPGLGSKKCLTCHTDHHKDGLSPKFRGGECARCHDQQNWKIKNFAHKKITGFALNGEHAKIACSECHKQNPGVRFVGLEQSCVSCHKDYHGFGKETSTKLGALIRCQVCHNETGWKTALDFNHNTDTSYKIDGKHLTVKCFECHTGKGKSNGLRTYEWPELETKTCETCHESPHRGNPLPAFKNKCTSCHVTDGWHVMGKSSGNFQHNTQTRFPLTGDHANLKCNQCHVRNGKEIYKFENAAGGFCDSCHKNPHQGQFRNKLVRQSCKECHNTSNFAQTQFNHNLARFLLTGAHKRIEKKCIECHKPTGKMLPHTNPPKPAHLFKLPNHEKSFCINCHKNIHERQFSFDASNCATCHNTTSFKRISAFDHDKTRFKIRGAHVKIKNRCESCHANNKFKFEFANRGFCESCHTNVHKDQFSAKFATKPCTECHTQNNFTQRLNFDHSKTSFKISGAHSQIESNCIKCHIKTDKKLPTKPPKTAHKFRFANQKTGFCESCHINEHNKQFHRKFAKMPCRECHNTAQFHKKQKFNHSLARFLLKGKHVEVACRECHVRTKETYKAEPNRLKGLYIWENLYSKDCALCHADPHKGRFGKRCSDCHNEEGWDETSAFHKNIMIGGVHNTLECAECHIEKRQLSGIGDDCKMCHQDDDPHQGAQPDCASCHTQQVWHATRFKHSLTDFPLRGAHRLLPCESCHAQGVYQGLDTSCVSCHFQDAAKVLFPNHQVGGFEQCQECHNQFIFPGSRASP